MTNLFRVAPCPKPQVSPAKKSGDLLPSKSAPRSLQLDFAANPNHYRANSNGKIKTPKLIKNPRIDQSPKLELSLTVQCGTVQEKDDGVEWWLPLCGEPY